MHPPHAAPTVSRRALLGGAVTTVGLLALVGTTSSCSSSGRSTKDDPLAALGHQLAKGPDGARLAGAPPDGLHAPIADQAALLAGLTALDATVRSDFGEGRTVLADGWLLSDTEAAALVAYAHG